MKIENPKFTDANSLLAKTVSGVTCGLRFPGQLNTSLRKQATNLVPFPRLHFFMDSLTSFGQFQNKVRKQDADEMLAYMLDNNSFMASPKLTDGRIMTDSAIFRGKVASSEAEKACHSIKSKNKKQFVRWNQDSIESALCDVPLPGEQMGGVFVGNNTSIQTIFSDLTNNFHKMFRRRAFAHWYTAVGVEEMQFYEAESNLNDLVSDYQPWMDMIAEEEG